MSYGRQETSDESPRQSELFQCDGVEDTPVECEAAADARRYHVDVEKYVVDGARPLTKKELRAWMEEIRVEHAESGYAVLFPAEGL